MEVQQTQRFGKLSLLYFNLYGPQLIDIFFRSIESIQYQFETSRGHIRKWASGRLSASIFTLISLKAFQALLSFFARGTSGPLTTCHPRNRKSNKNAKNFSERKLMMAIASRRFRPTQ